MKQSMHWVLAASILAAGLVGASAIHFAMFLHDGANFSQLGNRPTYKEIETEGWFFLRVFGCKFPVPNRYILRADVSSYLFFYYDHGDELLLQNRYPINFSVRDINGRNIHPHSDDFDIKYNVLKEIDGLIFEYITYDGKNGGYMISDNKQVARFLGGERSVVDLMFEYCMAHPIVESPLDCETRDGMTWCGTK